MKKLLSLLVLMTISANLWAVQAVIDGIKYEILKKAGQATVLSNNYTGNIVIPETVNYEGKECQVIAISNGAFKNCSKLVSVYIPDNVTDMGTNTFLSLHKTI